MFYCIFCKKEVILYGVCYSEGIEEGLNKFEQIMEKNNKIVLFNPAPIGPYHCPICNNRLIEKINNNK